RVPGDRPAAQRRGVGLWRRRSIVISHARQLGLSTVICVLLASCTSAPQPLTGQQPTMPPASAPSVGLAAPDGLLTRTLTATRSAAAATPLPVLTPTQRSAQTSVVAPVPTPSAAGAQAPTTVFLIVMENHNWSSILGNPAAPYINQTLLPQAASA